MALFVAGFAGFGCDLSSSESPAEIRVFSAAVLTEALEGIARDFEEAHDGVTVSTAFAGSQVLRLQIEQGAAADVFVSGHIDHIRALRDAGLTGHERTFAHGELVIIVPPDNPAGIESFFDLGNARRLVIGDDETPVGKYTRLLLEQARRTVGPKLEQLVLSSVVSKESNVRLVRAKVELGDADAAIVYLSDAHQSERVTVVPIPSDLNVGASYHASIVSASAREDLAAMFIDHLTSEAGGRVLERHGFEAKP